MSMTATSNLGAVASVRGGGPGNGNPPGPTTGPLIDFYTGSCVTNFSLYASNSVWFSSWFTSGEWCVLPSMSFPVVGGQTYQLSLDGVNGSYGVASLSFSFSPPAIPPSSPANDNFANAAILSGSALTITGTTVGATSEPGEPTSGSDRAARMVWYSWTAAASGNAKATASANDYSDLNVAVYAGSSLWTLIPVTVGSDQVSFYALAGTTYKIGWWGQTDRPRIFRCHSMAHHHHRRSLPPGNQTAATKFKSPASRVRVLLFKPRLTP